MLERWFVPHFAYADRGLADFMAARRAEPGAA
jgi:hemerythrin